MSFEEERVYLDKLLSEENKLKQPVPNSVQAL
jgi:hypothetical protein